VFARNDPPRSAFALAPPIRALVKSLQERRARTAADRELARRVRDAISRATSGAAGLSFYVHEGTVTVYGAVRDGAMREAILRVAAAQPGALRIIDQVADADVPAGL